MTSGVDDGVTTSMVFSITLPVTLTPVLTTAPATDMAAPAVAPATAMTPQPDKDADATINTDRADKTCIEVALIRRMTVCSAVKEVCRLSMLSAFAWLCVVVRVVRGGAWLWAVVSGSARL